MLTATAEGDVIVRATIMDGTEINAHFVRNFTIRVNPAFVPTFAFTVNAGAGGTVTGTASGLFEEDDSISVTAVPDGGHRFDSWTILGLNGVSSNTNPLAFNMPDNAVVLTANFVQEAATVTSVTVSPANIHVQLGTQQQFSATVHGTNDPSQDVSWTVEGSMSASTVISADGLLTVGLDESLSGFTVRATSTANPNIYGMAAIQPTTGTPAPVYDFSVNVSGHVYLPIRIRGIWAANAFDCDNYKHRQSSFEWLRYSLVRCRRKCFCVDYGDCKHRANAADR
jgi:hypothetical protein